LAATSPDSAIRLGSFGQIERREHAPFGFVRPIRDSAGDGGDGFRGSGPDATGKSCIETPDCELAAGQGAPLVAIKRGRPSDRAGIEGQGCEKAAARLPHAPDIDLRRRDQACHPEALTACTRPRDGPRQSRQLCATSGSCAAGRLKPWRHALRAERALPSAVFGPRLARPLTRLAWRLASLAGSVMHRCEAPGDMHSADLSMLLSPSCHLTRQVSAITTKRIHIQGNFPGGRDDSFLREGRFARQVAAKVLKRGSQTGKRI
jgi:hypothetical protein